jgi:thiamine-monophosphate kinase
VRVRYRPDIPRSRACPCRQARRPARHEPPGRQEAAITVAELGEFGLIAAIERLLPPGRGPLLGVGDDAAVVSAPDRRVVATTDLLVEGRHFRRDWSGPADIGVKAAAQNLADVAAMGAVPTALLVGLAAPGDLAADWALDLMRGLVAECERGGAVIAGGDVTSADTIMLGITALGDLEGRPPVTRAGARSGDVLAVAGRPGRSAAGLALLAAGRAEGQLPELASLVTAHRRPQPPYPAGPQAARLGATAMIDISDGLVQDAGHVAAASGVSIDIETARLPDPGPLRAAAEELGADWQEWALTGGEDHALAATFPPGTDLPEGWTVIGAVGHGSGILVNSRPHPGIGGWNHFG